VPARLEDSVITEKEQPVFWSKRWRCRDDPSRSEA